MSKTPAAKKTPKSLRPPLSVEPNAVELGRIRRSMARWRALDEPASLLGRGLGRDELLSRVARETGATLRQIAAALKGT